MRFRIKKAAPQISSKLKKEEIISSDFGSSAISTSHSS